MTGVRVLERIVSATVLGLRLHDPLTGETLPAGLTVTLRRDHGARLGPPVAAFVTGSRVYAFSGIPGLRDFEQADPDTLAQSPLPRLAYVLQIADPAGRFLPLALRLALPLPYRGLFPRGADEPPDSIGGDRVFPLFSAPTRRLAAWEAAVNGTLALADGSPAAFAAVELDFGDGLIHQGFADAAGRFVAPFAYPPAPLAPAASPPAPESLAEMEWTGQLRVHYDPGRLAIIGGTGLPDHLDMLEQLLGPASGLYPIPPDAGGVPVSFLPVALRRGRESIARTTGLPTLVITPVTGSP